MNYKDIRVSELAPTATVANAAAGRTLFERREDQGCLVEAFCTPGNVTPGAPLTRRPPASRLR